MLDLKINDLKKNWKISILRINSLLSAIPRTWIAKIEKSNFIYKEIPRATIMVRKCVKQISKLLSADIYWDLITKVTKPPTAISTWLDLFPFLEQVNWKYLFICINKVTSEPYLQSFQYKILNRTLNCNYNLFKWNILEHCMCHYCPLEIDTIEHHLYYCPESKMFWENIENWLESTIKIKFSFTICEVIFGMLDLDVNIRHSVNYILLLGKWYINLAKTNDKRMFLLDFINLVKEKLECIKLTCTLNDNEISFSTSFGILYQAM